ncbi:MAG: class I SAM-dependent methyltransferase [Gammaproteobacteria bacterium]
MPDWFESSLGRALLEQERHNCAGLVPSGYYPRSLQAGAPGADFLGGVESGERFFVGDSVESASRACGGRRKTHCAVAHASAMPFAERSQDLIMLPHTLDFCDDPHAVLREVSQILTPRGCVVITGFNPWSLWGAARLLKRASRRPLPWRGRYCRLGRVQDWLALLSFELVGARMLVYQPPLQNERWRRKLAYLDKAGARWWPGLGAVYVIIGRKQETAHGRRGATLLQWRRLLPGMAQPAAQRTAARTAVHLPLTKSNAKCAT